MALFSYFLYQLSNLIFIFLIPNEISKEFLNYYSIASGIFNFIIFYNYSKNFFINTNFVIILNLLILVYVFFFKNLLFITFVYVFLLLYSDYFFSQSNLKKHNLIFKLLLFLSSILLIFFNIYLVLIVKFFILLFFLIASKLKNIKIDKLNINSPLIYSFLTCLIYFGSLFLISIVSTGETVKIFYIGMQIFLGIKLKLFDLSVRKIKFKYFNLQKVFNLFAIIFFSIIAYYYYQLFLFGIFIISLLLLEYVRKNFIKN